MIEHAGLTFTDEHIRQARAEREREPFRTAWRLLLEHDQAGGLEAAQWAGLRYRFGGDEAAGERSAAALLDMGFDHSHESPLDGLAAMTAQAQVFEMTRDHPIFSASTQWPDAFAAHVADFNRAAGTLSPVETMWLGTLNIAAGILLEREDWFEAGAAAYRRTIRDEVRPEGYLPRAIEGQDGGSLRRQLLSVKALVLSAEMAAHVGVDLWSDASRGVSVMTACAYLTFYYYYPEKWRWDTLDQGETARLFRDQSGFLEMVNRRARPKNLKLLLDQLRPVYDVTGGGLTTLSHGVTERRGWFG